MKTKLLIEVEEHEIKNIEYLRRNKIDSAKISDIFKLLSQGYHFSVRPCRYCGSSFLFKEEHLVCLVCKCDLSKI